MSGVIGDLKLNLAIEDGQFKVTASNSGRVLSQLRQEFRSTAMSVDQIERHFDSFGRRLHYFVQGMASVRFLIKDFSDIFLTLPTSIAKTAGEFERLGKLMEGVSGAADAASRAVESMKSMQYVVNLSKNSPFEISALADAYVKLKTAGVDPTAGAMEGLTNSIAKFGGGSESLKRASIAIQQMSGKGVVSMEELRQQLGESVPNAMRMMANGMGLSMAELAKKVSTGTVSANSAIKKMLVQMQIDSAGAAEEMMKTLPGALSKLKTDWALMQQEMSGRGFMQAITEQVRELSKWMGSADGKRFAQEVGQALATAVHHLVALKDLMVEWLPVIQKAGIALVALWGGSKLRSEISMLGNWIKLQRDAAQAAVTAKNMQAQAQAKALLSEADVLAKRAAELERANAKEIEVFKSGSHARLTELDEELRKTEGKIKESVSRRQSLYAQAGAAERRANLLQTRLDAGRYPAGEQGAGRFFSRADRIAMQEELNALHARANQLRATAAAENASVQTTRANSAALAQNRIEAERNTKAARWYGITQREDQIKSTRQHIALLETQASQLGKVGGAARVALTATSTFAKGLLFSTAWAGGFTLALMGIAKAYDLITGASKKAAQAMKKEREERIGQGKATAQDAEDQKNQTYELAGQLASVQQKRARDEAAYRRMFASSPEGREAATDLRAGTIGRPEFDKLREGFVELRLRQAGLDDATLAQLKAELEKRRQLAARAMRDATETDESEKSDRLMATLDAEVERHVRDSELKKKWSELDKQKHSSDKKVAEQASRDLIIVTRKMVEERERVLKDAAARLRENPTAADGVLPGEMTPGVRAAFDRKLEDRLRQIREMAEHVTSPVDYVTADKSPAADRISGIEKYEAKLRADLASSEAELDVIRGKVDALAARRAQIRQDLLGKVYSGDLTDLAKDKDGKEQKKLMYSGEGDNKRIRPEYESWLESAVNDELRHAANTSAIATERKLKGELIEATERLGELRAEEGAQADRAADKIAKLRAELAKMLQSYRDAGGTSEAHETNLREHTEAMVRLAQVESAIDFESELRKGAASAEVQSEADKNQRIRAEFALDLERRRRLYEQHLTTIQKMNFSELGGEEEKARQIEALTRSWSDYQINKRTELERRTETAMDRMLRQYKDVAGQMQQLTATWTDNFLDGITQAVTGGEFKMKEFMASVMRDIAKVHLKKTIGDSVGSAFSLLGSVAGDNTPSSSKGGAGVDQSAKKASEALSKVGAAADDTSDSFIGVAVKGLARWVSSLFASSTAQQAADAAEGVSKTQQVLATEAASLALWDLAASAAAASVSSAGSSVTAFAMGGIMSSAGSLPLNYYANGGIATTPQLAVFGEGRMNEAYVPLPDGRTIPVTMTGGQTSNSVVIGITVYEADGTVQTSDSSSGIWGELADRVTQLVRGELATQSRSGGIISQR